MVQILSNEEKRNIYDIYGKEGLEAGLEVGEPLRSPNELKTEYEKFKAQQASRPIYRVISGCQRATFSKHLTPICQIV